MSAPWSPVTFLGAFAGTLPEPLLPELAFAGRSNAGKSSALNCLLGNAVARVSHTPGRTQTINLFQIGATWVAADLPGYGYAKVAHDKREAWKGWIEAYITERENLRGVVVLVDGRLDPQPPDLQLIDWLRAVDRPLLVLATKLDALSRQKRAPAVEKLRRGLGLVPEEILGFSSREDIGWAEARKRIRGFVSGSEQPNSALR